MNNVDDEESSNESENYFNLSNVKGKQEETHLQKKRRKAKNITNGNVNSSNNNNNNNNSHKRSKQICQFYINGACNKGDKCKYSHECEQIHKKELCKFYLSNTCTKGDKCLYSHNLKDYPCKFYHARGFCENCENCRFSHARLNEHELMEFIKQNEDFLMETKKKYGQTNMDEFFDEYLKNKMEVINGQEIKMIPNELKDLPSYNNTSTNNGSNVNGKGNMPLGVLLIASNQKIMMEIMKNNMVNNNNNSNNSKICEENNVNVCSNKKEVPLLVNPFISPSQINDDYIQQFINSSTSTNGKNYK